MQKSESTKFNRAKQISARICLVNLFFTKRKAFYKRFVETVSNSCMLNFEPEDNRNINNKNDNPNKLIIVIKSK